MRKKLNVGALADHLEKNPNEVKGKFGKFRILYRIIIYNTERQTFNSYYPWQQNKKINEPGRNVAYFHFPASVLQTTHYRKDVIKLEKVWKRFTRILPELGYNEKLDRLGKRH